MDGDHQEKGLVVVRGAADGFVQDVIAGAHQLRSDEPVEAGGTDTGPTPYEYAQDSAKCDTQDTRLTVIDREIRTTLQ